MRIFLILMCTALGFIYAEILRPIPLQNHNDRLKALLGKKLFFDPGLSKNGTIACVSCHHLPGNGADNVPLSKGIYNQEEDLNTPTVLNASLSFVFTSSGKAKTLQEQVKIPITHPKEMGNTIREVIIYLKSRPEYVKEFKKNYPSGISEANFLDAIAQFEKALLTPDSRFDRYLRGEQNVLNSTEKKGGRLFREYGCITCHNGIGVGGNMYQKIGIYAPYDPTDKPEGRIIITGRAADDHVFKVPSLRNIALTAPYFHDGSIKTLQDAIKAMGYFQLGIKINDDDVIAIEAFLKTLTGNPPAILKE